MAIANPAYPPLLNRGRLALIGQITALNTPVEFGLVVDTASWRGQLQLVAQGGAVTTPTWVLEASIDNGTSWFVLPVGTTYTLTGEFTGDTASTFAARYDVSGMAGALFKFGLTAGSAITAMNIFGLIG